ncbi:Uncharacterised protein [Mycobacteroides abscessus subsp. abscessus]|nr:Uncharacterised protein [Mycobacteroides abscessus subsp. abscessus]
MNLNTSSGLLNAMLLLVFPLVPRIMTARCEPMEPVLPAGQPYVARMLRVTTDRLAFTL